MQTYIVECPSCKATVEYAEDSNEYYCHSSHSSLKYQNVYFGDITDNVLVPLLLCISTACFIFSIMLLVS